MSGVLELVHVERTRNRQLMHYNFNFNYFGSGHDAIFKMRQVRLGNLTFFKFHKSTKPFIYTQIAQAKERPINFVFFLNLVMHEIIKTEATCNIS